MNHKRQARARVFATCVTREEAIEDAVHSIVKMLGVEDALKRARHVVLKPNFVVAEDWHNGTVTSTPVIMAAAAYIRGVAPGARITVGEGGFTSQTAEAFERNGVFRAFKPLGIDVVDFNADERIPVEIPGARALKATVYLSRVAVECDCIVSLPALKTHSLAVTTLSMKNFMGTMSNKSIMHSRLHEKINDLYSYFRPKAPFAVVDGFVGNEGYECAANPVNHGIILASTDLVALDTVGSYLMGQNLSACKYLAVGAARGFGESDMARIGVHGIDVAARVKRYKRGRG
ncbi:MAG: DUF362 domain-containing protein [Candidatus Lokiarchaeota archaeon]|nr:DUF362 domain-containing protein [Candidatus Lokiarchaeota archaeon]